MAESYAPQRKQQLTQMLLLLSQAHTLAQMPPESPVCRPCTLAHTLTDRHSQQNFEYVCPQHGAGKERCRACGRTKCPCHECDEAKFVPGTFVFDRALSSLQQALHCTATGPLFTREQTADAVYMLGRMMGWSTTTSTLT